MTNESRSPEEIEREIERERAGLTNTLDDLQDKFSIESIARQVSDQFREHGGDIGRSVSEAVKRNPVALALTGVGLAWLIMGDKTDGRDRYEHNRSYGRPDFNYNDYERGVRTRARTADFNPGGSVTRPARGAAGDSQSTVADKAKNVAETVSDAAQSAADSAQNFASSASDRAATWRDQLAEGTESFTEEARNRVIAARESAINARDAAASYTREGRDRAVDMFEEQPLIAGALAVALGAALGAALPRSRMEDQYFGEQSDKLFDDAERIFEEEKQKLVKVATAATDEAKKVAREAKENADEAAPADTIGQAVADEAKSSGKRIVDAAESEAQRQNLGDIKKS